MGLNRNPGDLEMKFRIAALLAALAMTAPGLAAADAVQPTAAVPTKVAETKAALRDLWLGHVFWVRNVVDARLAGDATRAKASEQQVVANAKAIAGAIEPFYGKAASDKLFGLLAGHWGAISDYLNGAHAGKKADQDGAYKKLVANADEIAVFLSGANPHLPANALRSLLTAHGAHHVQQIQQLQAKQYEQEAKTWTAMKDHMYVIADALASGIAAQFPEKFR
jgi:hypothetical protein